MKNDHKITPSTKKTDRIDTPTPPQVMDPSKAPDTQKKPGTGKEKGKKAENADDKKLAPREEL